MIARLNHPDYDRWANQIKRTGGCRQPIHLRGKVDHYDPATGHLLHRYTTRTEPDGILRVPCKTRRASRCPACAETYRADTYHLIRAGLVGGKGVPETVTTHPTLFVTLTAPSFGAVHTRREHNRKAQPCHARRNATTCPHGRVMSCNARHGKDDPRLGEPLCPDCYDYTGSVPEPDLAELRLADWAHMLGFRGHFSTRSRHYSTTLGDIRADREHHARLNDITTGRLPLFDEDTVLVISEWEYAGKGHSLGDQLLAAAITGTQLGGVHDL
ncbi:replication initiator [Nonomuraea angiospora]|uniref:replication initiator n=1 Tax=Nonomuraea angiospora TaxID=46172 RepID=UPI0029ADADBD|nr:replication initiator [Nonomuraea angiospora]MDX3110586.1 hypothetical protein [Nonomuraea angiospora]